MNTDTRNNRPVSGGYGLFLNYGDKANKALDGEFSVIRSGGSTDKAHFDQNYVRRRRISDIRFYCLFYWR